LARPPSAAQWPLLAVLAGAISAAGLARTAAPPASAAPAQASATRGIRPNLASTIDRPLRYRPDGLDFVIENGAEFFNRPLYGGHTAFRVDAGDRPEFTLYLPGRGGNLRFGLRAPAGSKWLHETARVVARYRPGSMVYEVRDPLLGASGVVRLSVLALHTSEGLIARIEASALPSGVELLWAYGGVNGQRGQRDGDIGTENVPISEYFQLRPEFCEGNSFTIGPGTFTLHAAPATIVGLVPAEAWQAVADATRWGSSADLLASGDQTAQRPVIVGRTALASGRPLFVALQRVPGGPLPAAGSPASPGGGTGSPASGRGQTPQTTNATLEAADLPAEFDQTDDHFRVLRERVAVDTPDPFLNAAVAALNVAADAVWDEPSGTVQHGAVAWRSRLLGWRGPYAMDALGWHDRARRHLTYWAGRQNVDPAPPALPPPDANANLARSEAALHTSGDLSNSHYDMNLVYIDALLRHLLWTGDLGFARQAWPVIERHLAWERRLFRREFGPDRLPLYEAYAAIWASDDLQYHGGGVAHASAYNAYHNGMAARLAGLLGRDPAPYEHEAALIKRAMREHLWLADRGWFAEFKDLLGRQLVHPSFGVWTFYHVLDAGLATPFEAWQMTRGVDLRIPHLPVGGAGVPRDEPYAVVSTTDWMPYTWSINNVVFAENMHTALGYWQAGRPDDAFRLMKSALLASMFMGITPGNVGSMNDLDVYRRESQRDFADGSGVMSRALVEGLFGIRPDALAGELGAAPGLPSSWDHASLRHPDVTFDYRRLGDTETYTIDARFERPQALVLTVPARRDRVASVTLNGRPVAWRPVADAVRAPRIEIRGAASRRHEVTVAWTGGALTAGVAAGGAPFERRAQGEMVWWNPAGPTPAEPSPPQLTPLDWTRRIPPSTRLEPIGLAQHFNDRVTEIFRPGKYVSPRSPFCSLAIPSQGIGAWAGHVSQMAEIDDSGLREIAGRGAGRFVLPNSVPFATPGPGGADNVLFTSQWDNYPREVNVPLTGRAHHLYLLMAGSTNHMQSRLDNGEVVVTYDDGTTARLALHNPTTWWPIDQDYFIDDFAFARPGPIPPRVDLKTGRVRILDVETFRGTGTTVPGGAATVLHLPLDPDKPLRSLTVRALANEVIIGLMAATLARDSGGRSFAFRGAT